MLVTELKLDEMVILKDRSSGEFLAEVKIASFIQYRSHIAVRLGFTAPQSVRISVPNGNKDLRKNGDEQ